MRYFEKIKYWLVFSKISVLGVFSLFELNGISQIDSLECDRGIEKAIQDSEGGIYNSHTINSWVIDSCEPNEQDYYLDYKIEFAKTNYNIILLSTFSKPNKFENCYTIKMDSIIKEKFGDSIYNKLNFEARKSYSLKLLNENDSTHVFKFADTYPKFANGFDSMYIFINKNIKYPNHSFGTVYCSFVVNVDGSLSDFKIMKGVDENTDQEIIRILKLMTNWTPGVLGGQKVRVEYILPIKFNT